jgi:hypothetical protein
VNGGPFHSQSPEAFFVGVAGLKVVVPGSLDDAYGLLRSAIDDDDPVLFFEHKALYRRLREPRPDPAFRVPLGEARVARAGTDATVVTYGAGVDLALRASEQLDVEVLDLRTVWPIDEDAVLSSLEKTSKLLVLQEPPGATGAAGHVLALVAEQGFELLDAPPQLLSPRRRQSLSRLRSSRPISHRPSASAKASRGSLSTETQAAAPASDLESVSRATRLELLRLMLLQRLTEERIMALYRQGQIVGSVYTGYMQEAVAAEAGLAVEPDDAAAPLNREMAFHFTRGVPVSAVFAQFLGKATGPTRGRDGNMHFGVPERLIFPLPSMLGDTLTVIVGAALAFKRRGEPRIGISFLGDGAMSTGDSTKGSTSRRSGAHRWSW